MSESHGREARARRETEERLGSSIDAEGRRINDPSRAEDPRPVKGVREDREVEEAQASKLQPM